VCSFQLIVRQVHICLGQPLSRPQLAEYGPLRLNWCRLSQYRAKKKL
jgi:hypothetical protein